jgi:hypothetical protein
MVALAALRRTPPVSVQMPVLTTKQDRATERQRRCAPRSRIASAGKAEQLTAVADIDLRVAGAGIE